MCPRPPGSSKKADWPGKQKTRRLKRHQRKKLSNSLSSSIEGKIALVTGGSTGIGFAAVQRFAREGASVAIANVNAERGQAAAQMIRDDGGEAIFVQADVSDAAQVEALVASVVSHCGGLNYAFNNAGIGGDLGPIHLATPENFERVIAVNLTGIWLSMKFEIQHMMENGGGVIINNSSTAGGRAMPGLSAYVASKFGVNAITKAAALEYAAAGIRVNAVMPGPVQTPGLQGIIDAVPEAEGQFLAMTPQNRVADAREIAAAVVWLASDEASFVTGTNFPVDGGMLES
jgi:NAD(P)-dependent dehydrogenase (short-subunit alcohol dehydrogenase family)